MHHRLYAGTGNTDLMDPVLSFTTAAGFGQAPYAGGFTNVTASRRDSRVVELRLSRVAGKKLAVALDGRVKIRRGGPIVRRWKPGRNAVAKLRAGTYVLRLKVGPGAKRLARQSDETTVRLTAAPLAPVSGRRR